MSITVIMLADVFDTDRVLMSAGTTQTLPDSFATALVQQRRARLAEPVTPPRETGDAKALFVGAFDTIALLTQQKPVASYAGCTATVAGQQVYCNGAAWLVVGDLPPMTAAELAAYPTAGLVANVSRAYVYFPEESKGDFIWNGATWAAVSAGGGGPVLSPAHTVTMPAPTGGDDTAALNAVLAAAPAGAHVHWYPGGTYLISGTNGVNSTKGHIHFGHGATLVRDAAEYATLPTSGSAMLKIANESNTITFAGVPVTAGQTTFTMPTGALMPAVGDLARFRSGDTRVAAGSYLYGWESEISDVTGQVVTLAEPFPEAMSVIVIVYSKGVRDVVVDTLHFDQTNMPAITPMPEHRGIYIRGHGVRVDNCRFNGSINSVCAAYLAGKHLIYTRCKARWYYNNTTLFGGGGGREGYGVQISGDYAEVSHSEFLGCKHSAVFGGDRNSVNRGATFRKNRVIELQSMPNATDAILGHTGAVDTHCNLLGHFIVDDNDIDCVNYAANYRAGIGKFTNNRVRQVGTSTIFSALFWYELSASDIDCDGNEFWFNDSTGKVLGTPFDLAQPQKGIRIRNNTVRGGSIVATSPTVAALELFVEDNIGLALDRSGVTIGITANAGVVITGAIRRNTFVGKSTASGPGINLSSGTANQRLATLRNFEVEDNDIDWSAVAATVYAMDTTNAVWVGGKIVGNKLKRNPDGVNSNIRGLMMRGTQTTGLRIHGNEIKDGYFVIESNGGVQATHTDLDIGCGNELSILLLSEAATASPLVFLGSSITSNHFRRPDTSAMIQYAPQAGSTAMAASDRLLVQSNTLMGTTGSGNAVTLTANATGHKIEFLDNTLSRPILDSSGTYYGIPRNTVTAGAQAWRGGTTARADGTLTASAAPSTGTFAVGDRVQHSAPASGSPEGWVCTTAPTTFAAMAALV